MDGKKTQRERKRDEMRGKDEEDGMILKKKGVWGRTEVTEGHEQRELLSPRMKAVPTAHSRPPAGGAQG